MEETKVRKLAVPSRRRDGTRPLEPRYSSALLEDFLRVDTKPLVSPIYRDYSIV